MSAKQDLKHMSDAQLRAEVERLRAELAAAQSRADGAESMRKAVEGHALDIEAKLAAANALRTAAEQRVLDAMASLFLKRYPSLADNRRTVIHWGNTDEVFEAELARREGR